jgi:hypothetical protein
MDRHCYRARRIADKHQHMVTADHPINDKSSAL